jgi:hypothetical protein
VVQIFVKPDAELALARAHRQAGAAALQPELRITQKRGKIARPVVGNISSL